MTGKAATDRETEILSQACFERIVLPLTDKGTVPEVDENLARLYAVLLLALLVIPKRESTSDRAIDLPDSVDLSDSVDLDPVRPAVLTAKVSALLAVAVKTEVILIQALLYM